MRHVIVGNGMAGITAVSAIGRLDPEARITIVTEDPTRFYSRPGLMYYMMGLLKEWDLRIAKDDGFYRGLGAEVVRARAALVRAEEPVLDLASGRSLPFDRLLLATGSVSRRLRVPGADLDGIYYMYSLADCEQIMARTRRGQRAVLLGGGLLGAELAEVWRHYGLDVTFLVQEPWYFPKGLNETQGRIVEAEIRRHGVDLYLNERVAALRGDGAVSHVVTESGAEFPADAVGVTIGVDPNIELARASGIATGRGLVVDAHLRTSREHVYAAGDCAEVHLADDRPGLVEQLWYSAERQGQAAARAMCGDPRPYDPGLFYNSAMFFGASYVAIGASHAGEGEEETTFLARHGRAARRFVHRQGVVIGITSVGVGENANVLTALVREGTSVEAAMTRLGGRGWTRNDSNDAH